ncbi:DUF218 domain-containing protein [Xylariales sp. PMI_506]|nr:DUF218 domain-containing protein [Xylariales sp. PMI_506]
MTLPTHLIVVCCHGIWLGGHRLGFDENEWLIAPFQAGETPTFIEHIKIGLTLLNNVDGDGVLMFSGGPTRKETTISEATSYARLAAANNHFGLLSRPVSQYHIAEEARALDSYYNVLFSLTKFWEDYGRRWPARLTIVSHSFKRERLVDCHCGPAAIDYPLKWVSFAGADPPTMRDGSNEAAIRGSAHAVAEWRADPHGVGESLAGKRRARNPWAVPQTLFSSEENQRESGVRTKAVVGCGEVLDAGFAQPWSRRDLTTIDENKQVD